MTKKHIHVYSQPDYFNVTDENGKPMAVLIRRCQYYFNPHSQCPEFLAFDYVPRDVAKERLEEL